ncbi:MAG: ornithine cyclodeaminase family protein [Terracoccus sp.]
MDLPFIDGPQLVQVLSWAVVIESLEAALASGAAPGNTPPRSFASVGSGQLILMPGEVGADVGVKVVSLAPGNSARGLARIQGVHIVFDGDTLRPRALIEAATLTLRRTAGLSAFAVKHLAPDAAASLLVFGTGPQALAHVGAINEVRPLSDVVIVGRRPKAVDDVVGQVEALGLRARAGTAGDVADVDIVACCTSAVTPLFDSGLLRPEACVTAIGSHDPDAREVDTALVACATVVVETRQSALSQAGDIVLALADGVPEADAIAGDLGELARGEVHPASGRPRLFKGVGEAWSDVVVAAAAVDGVLRGESG